MRERASPGLADTMVLPLHPSGGPGNAHMAASLEVIERDGASDVQPQFAFVRATNAVG
jgi:hypothetical protein